MIILIVDIETTGWLNAGGEIVELGIVELDLNTGDKKIVYNQVIKPEITLEELKETWIVKNGYMDADEIMKGVEFSAIKNDVQEIFNHYPDGATAYNKKFDFDFLKKYGITFPKELPCPMLKSVNICKLPGRFGKYKWAKVEEAYKHFFPESEYVELHRGADDAFHEADIVLALHKINSFL